MPRTANLKIYRDFDTYDTGTSVSAEVQAWCEVDLGLTKTHAVLQGTVDAGRESVVYDSASGGLQHLGNGRQFQTAQPARSSREHVIQG